MRAGDVLVVPTGWFHAAHAEEGGVSLSARAYSTCEMLSFWDVDGWQLLARLGLVADRTDDDDDDDDEANACLFTKCCLADVREAAGHARS